MNTFSLQGNWVDLVILVIITLFLSEAFRVGFWVIVADFFAFLLSLIFALRAYQWTSMLLRDNFLLSHSVSNALAFLFVAIITEAIISYLLSLIIRRIPLKYWKGAWSKILAVFPAVGEGLVLVSFILTLIIGLPLSPKIKTYVSESKIGGILIQQTSGLEARVNDIFGGVIEDSLTYLTIRPESRESIPITVGKKELTIDEKAETGMYKLVNEERKKRGVKLLEWRSEVVPIARAHATDMWEKGYFGHISGEGEDVSDRLNKEDINYRVAGENLALAPTVTTALNGLMNSEGHRENILDLGFKRVGIGVIDNGVYGKIFVQVFTD